MCSGGVCPAAGESGTAFGQMAVGAVHEVHLIFIRGADLLP